MAEKRVPELWTLKDVADYFGVRLETTHQWRYHREKQGFPREIRRYGRVPVFDPEEVKRWGERTNRVPA